MINIDLNPKKKSKIIKKELNLKGLLSGFKNVELGGSLAEKSIYVVPIVILSFTAGFYFYTQNKYNQLEQEVKDLESQLKKYNSLQAYANKIKKEFEKILEEEKRMQLKLKVFEALKSEKKTFTPMINTVVVKVPDGIWFESLEVDKNKILLTGYSLNSENISLFYKNLSSYFSNITFGKVKDKQEIQGIVALKSPLNINYYKFVLEISGYKGL
jgi:type IV pilus assembly protein PilN